MHFNVVCPRVEHRVPSQIDTVTAHVVAVKRNWILDGYAQILENPLEPYGRLLFADRATVGCFSLLQDMASLPRENSNPEVDLLSAL